MTTYNKRDLRRLSRAVKSLETAYDILDALPQVDNDLLNEVLRLATANAYLAKNHADDLLYYATRDSAAEGE